MYERAYQAGVPFEQFLADTVSNREFWHAVTSRAQVAPTAVEQARGIPGNWRLLALADDWCGDAVNILPVVFRLADALDAVELRVVSRDAWPQLMDRHMTNRSRSIPVIILLDEKGACRGWWGPRPSELQSWFEAHGRALPKEERYRELRRWYARDRGATITAEIVDLLACAAAPAGPGCSGPVRHCAERLAA